MNKRIYAVVGAISLGVAGLAVSQEMILNMAANKVVGKYQSASCEQLWQEKMSHAPKTAEEQKAVAYLRGNPQAREEFIGKVAAPVVNKMFECGMIP
jgi:hypothetical protein